MSPLTYLTHLTTRFLHLGGHIHRAHITSLSSLPQTCKSLQIPAPRTIIVATGIGSLSLPGVEDTTVFPTTGQVVIIHAPWIKSGWTRQEGSLEGGEGGRRNYVIPRSNGEVVLGGTREVGNWYVQAVRIIGYANRGIHS
jgi:D-amino-acid oxidase